MWLLALTIDIQKPEPDERGGSSDKGEGEPFRASPHPLKELQTSLFYNRLAGKALGR
jgi:hypothetical protein